MSFEERKDKKLVRDWQTRLVQLEYIQFVRKYFAKTTDSINNVKDSNIHNDIVENPSNVQSDILNVIQLNGSICQREREDNDNTNNMNNDKNDNDNIQDTSIDIPDNKLQERVSSKEVIKHVKTKKNKQLKNTSLRLGRNKLFKKTKNKEMKSRHLTRMKDFKTKYRIFEKLPTCNSVTVKKHLNKLMLPLQIGQLNKTVQWEVDTGSPISIISENILKDIFPNFRDKCKISKNNMTFYGITGKCLDIQEKVKLSFKIDENSETSKFVFHISSINNICILGRDFLSENNTQIIFSKGQYFVNFPDIKKRIFPFTGENVTIKKLESKPIEFNLNMKGRFLLEIVRNKCNLVCPPSLIETNDGKCFVQLYNPFKQDLILKENDFFIKCTNVGNEEITSIVPPNKNIIFFESFHNSHPLLGLTVNTSNLGLHSKKMFNSFNYCNTHVCQTCIENVPKMGGVFFVDLEKFHDFHTNHSIHSVEFLSDIQQCENNLELTLPEIELRKETIEFIDEKVKEFPIEFREKVKKCFTRNYMVKTSTYKIPQIDEYLDFALKKEIPKNTKIYPVKNEYKKILFHTLQVLMLNGLIKRAPFNRSWGAPIFLIPRKDKGSVRIIIDQRQHNECIEGDVKCSMLDVTSQLKSMASNAKIISTVDVSNLYYHIPYSSRVVNSGYSQFITEYGAFCLNVASTGASNLPAYVFDYILRNIFRDLDGNPSFLEDFCFHFDDFNIYTRKQHTISDHVDKCILVLDRLNKMKFTVNLSKCKFAIDLEKTPIDILGYKLFNYKLTVPDSKVSNILQCLKTPKTIRENQILCGTINFFRTILPVSGLLALSTISATVKNNKLNWNDTAEQAVNHLKHLFISKEVEISIPNEQSVGIIYSDASSLAGGEY